MRVVDLKALAKEHGLRGYFKVPRDQFVKPLSNYCLIKKNFD